MPAVAQKITPHLWYDTKAKEAAEFYASVFPNSKITSVTTIHNTPSGDSDIVSFHLGGQSFMAISAGPYFKFNPSISLLVKCQTKDETDVFWAKLSSGGSVLMELGSYPFSEKYGWLKDKFGVSWQIVPADMEEMMQHGTPDQIARVTEVFLKMKKFDLATLKAAYTGI